MENWVKIHEKGYYASDLGRIKSPRGKILRPYKDSKGYLRIDLPNKRVKVHRIIASHFMQNPDNLPQVNHKDTDKTNNAASNLEWCTNAENMAHAVKNGALANRKIRGGNNGMAILTESDAMEILKLFKPRIFTRKMLAKEFNVSEATIKDVVIGRRWKHVKR